VASKNSIEQLYIVTILLDTLNSFFEVAYRSFLPTIVPRERLIEGNSKLAASSSLAEIGGPSLAGLLSEIVDVRVTLLIGSAGVLCSSLWLLFSPVRQLC
jgi:predicted MFS family arabinose efflux permease